MNIRSILFFNGVMITMLAHAMLMPLLIDLQQGREEWKVFFISFVITSFFGGSLTLINASRSIVMSTRDIFLLIVSGWVLAAIFGSLPFHFSTVNMTYTDAFFETVSGITTTGSTVMASLDTAPVSLLLWRALLQWMGGIAIVISAIMIIPYLNVAGMQLFRSEISSSDNTTPRTAKLAQNIIILYITLTMICAALYVLGGMNPIEGISHAMATISTGGYSTHDQSLAYFNSIFIEITAITFMIIGSLPFILYIKALRGNARPLLRDEQVRWFLTILISCILVLCAYLYVYKGFSMAQAFRFSSFSVISLTTGTAFTLSNHNEWSHFSASLLFYLMLIGGCAGSTACGLKVFRFQVLYDIIGIQIKRLIYPSGVFRADFNGKPIPPDVPFSVMGFFFLYAMTCVAIALLLAMTGMNVTESFTAAVTSVSNAGPGMGSIGPSGNFAGLSETAKWILCAGMMLGRLEIVTVLILFTPQFWRH